MDAPCRIEMLGRLQIKQAGRTINRFRTYKTGVLLAYLAYYPQRSHPREHLIDLLWPDCEPAQGRNSLSQAISSLRHQLEPPGVSAGAVLVADRTSIRLNAEMFATDAGEFEADLRRATEAETDRASSGGSLQFLLSATTLYKGELLPGRYEDWVLKERERLVEEYLRALDQLQAHWESVGDLDRAIACARQAIDADALREQSHAALIRLYVAAGQRSAAVRQYQELERLLDKELGVAPDPSVEALLGASAAVADPSADPPPAVTATVRTGSPPVLQPVGAGLPVGTVTLLLADPPRRDEDIATWRSLLHRYRGEAIQASDDMWLAAFGRASDAVECAVATARSHTEETAGRLAVLTAEVGDQIGVTLLSDRQLLHALRLLGAAHPGQTLCSEGTAGLLRWDLEPGLRIVDLGVYRLSGEEELERLFEIEHPGRIHDSFPPPDAQPGFAGNLPLQLTHFFGREQEIGWLTQRLNQIAHGNVSDSANPARPNSTGDDSRITTITGPGGTGKTRLVLEVARRMLEAYQGAVWFVPLADLVEPNLIPKAILDALHLACSPHGDPLIQVAAALSRQPTLLILDNFEQLLDAEANACESSQIVRSLLERVPTLTCLVTSRRTLGLIGEREIALMPLPIPDPADADSPVSLSECESVSLFVDRAQIVRPDFQVTAGNAAAVASLCQRLEGIPLALELAAARCQVLTPAQILARLTHRLDFLVSRQPDRAPRHQTLRAAIDWSYCVLPPDVQRFFSCLSVFRGGFTLDAAEIVCEEPLALDHLAHLRECSLVQANEHPGYSGGMRFRLLETLREYGEERLEPEVRHRAEALHAEYYLSLADEAEREMAGPGQGQALLRLDAEHENLRVALTHFIRTADADRALRLVCALGTFWGVRGHIREARERFSAVRALAGGQLRTATRAKASDLAGTFALNQGEFASARALYEESLAIYRELGNSQGVGDLLRSLGALAFEEGDYAAARSLWEESLSVFRALGNARSIAIVLKDLAYARSRLGDYETALPLFEESLRFFRPLGRHTGAAVVLIYYADSLREKGDYEAARPLCEESLAIFRDLGNQGGVAMALLTLSDVLCEQGEYALAETLCRESLTIYREMGDKDGIADVLYCRGKIACGRGDYRAAGSLFDESLELYRDLGSKVSISRSLDALTNLAILQGQPQRAAILSAAADRLREASQRVRTPAEQTLYLRNFAAIRSKLGEDALATLTTQALTLPWDQAIVHAMDSVAVFAQNRLPQ